MTVKTLTLGFSPCPNDTFLFYPLVHGLVDTDGFAFKERLEDVETLNHLALEGVPDVCKVSCHAFAFLREHYVLLRSGGAMGRGCGPLVVSREPVTPEDLRQKRIAAPGRYTTALLLFNLLQVNPGEIVLLPFHEIMDAVARRTVDAGLVIHESRFTYPSYGLHQVIDLGIWWGGLTGLPLPLGGIAARRSLGTPVLSALDRIVRSSVRYARSHPEESARYVRSHSREMSDEVCASHISLYVNDFSLDPGREGEQALETLLSLAERRGLIPGSTTDSYLPRP
jgi:1,4-dihydroxy-6-naphthoate synthase